MNPKRYLLLRRKEVVAQLPPMTEVVRGSLIQRRLVCGKPNCRCAKGQRHRVWYLTVSFARGRTEQVTVPEELVPEVERWLSNYERWWYGLEEISGINRELLRKRWVGRSQKKKRKR